MNADRKISIAAICLAGVALANSYFTSRSSPLGTSITNYDLKSPEAVLGSMREMAKREDLRAAWQYFRLSLVSSGDVGFALLVDDVAELRFLKSVEVTGSGNKINNGKIVSFIKFKRDGVEYRYIQYFEKKGETYFLSSPYVKPYVESDVTEKDSSIKAQIDRFESTGEV